MLEQTMQDGVKPDDCILLDLDVETAIRRTGKRTTEASRFDTETRDFFRRARQRFLDVARAGRLGQKNIIVNGHKGPETILHEIVESLGIGGRPAAVRRLPPPSWPKQRQGHERADPGIAEVMKWEYHAGDYLFMQAVPRRPNQADDIISVLADVASRHDLTTVAELPDKMRERFANLHRMVQTGLLKPGSRDEIAAGMKVDIANRYESFCDTLQQQQELRTEHESALAT